MLVIFEVMIQFVGYCLVLLVSEIQIIYLQCLEYLF